MEFCKKTKEELVSAIQTNCFSGNFGSLSKSDFELMLFHYYMESLREQARTAYKNEDITEPKKTNYGIAVELGITVQKVVSLKDKEASKYPYSEEVWKKRFLEYVVKAHITDNTIVLNITDRRLYRSLESFLEAEGIGVENSLNPSIFKTDQDKLLDLIKKLYPEKTKEIKELEKIAREQKKKALKEEIQDTFKGIGIAVASGLLLLLAA